VRLRATEAKGGGTLCANEVEIEGSKKYRVPDDIFEEKNCVWDQKKPEKSQSAHKIYETVLLTKW